MAGEKEALLAMAQALADEAAGMADVFDRTAGYGSAEMPGGLEEAAALAPVDLPGGADQAAGEPAEDPLAPPGFAGLEEAFENPEATSGVQMPGELPEVPGAEGPVADDFAPPETAADSPFAMPEMPGALPDLTPPQLPEGVPDTDDYYPDQPQVQPQQGAGGPDNGDFQFSNWTEQDGSIVFEDGGGGGQSGAPPGPEQTAFPDRAADEPDEAPMANVLGDVYGVLQAIQDGIAQLTGARGQSQGGNLNLPTGPANLAWGSPGGATPLPESMETYAAGSPGILNATTMSGIRGAGGYGGGSRPNVPSIDVTEPSKRLASHGEA